MLKGVKRLKRQRLSLLLAVFKPVGGNGVEGLGIQIEAGKVACH